MTKKTCSQMRCCITFQYDDTFSSMKSTPLIELNHKNICRKVKNPTTTMAKNEKTYAGMLTLKCTY